MTRDNVGGEQTLNYVTRDFFWCGFPVSMETPPKQFSGRIEKNQV